VVAAVERAEAEQLFGEHSRERVLEHWRDGGFDRA
jgi:hypothetical protein